MNPSAFPFPRRKRDDLPEDTDYKAGGCPPICETGFDCPLPQCILDLPNGLNSLRHLQAVTRAGELRGQGLSVREVAAAMGVHRRQVQRLLKEAKE